MSTNVNAESEVLHHLLRERWSPREFLSRPVEPEKLRSVFEAARWAASCFNEQPWRFVVATQADPAAFARVLGLLAGKNQQWARTAWAVGFSTAKKTFSHSGAPNRFGLHDAGAASANMAIEATAWACGCISWADSTLPRRGLNSTFQTISRSGRRSRSGISMKNWRCRLSGAGKPGRDRFWSRLGLAQSILGLFFAVWTPCSSLTDLDRYQGSRTPKIKKPTSIEMGFGSLRRSG